MKVYVVLLDLIFLGKYNLEGKGCVYYFCYFYGKFFLLFVKNISKFLNVVCIISIKVCCNYCYG